MHIVNYNEVENKNVEEGALKTKIRWLITKKMGAKNFFMRLFEVEPGGYTPYHKHNWEHEIFILDGNGAVKKEDGEVELKKGFAIYIPENEYHQLKNNGNSILKFICLIPNK